MMMINGTPRQAGCGWRRRKASETDRLGKRGRGGWLRGNFRLLFPSDFGGGKSWRTSMEWKAEAAASDFAGAMSRLFVFFLGNDVRWPMALLAAAVSSQMGGYLACYIELRRKGLLRSCWVDAIAAVHSFLFFSGV